MKRKLLAIAILAIVFLFSSATTKVLIIGAGNFRDSRIIPLPGAITDANLFQKTILDLGIAKASDVTFLSDPSFGILASEVEAFFNNTQPQDKLIFYYGGHGYAKDGKTYLVPWDTNPDYIHITGYNLTDNLSRLLAVTKAEDVILIMDACYSGSIVRDRPLLGARVETTNLEDVIKQKAVLLLSSGPTEVSQEKPTGGGWFTHYLIEALKGEAGKGKEWITTKDIFEYVRQTVSRQTNGKQNPMLVGQKEIPMVRNINENYKQLALEILKIRFEKKISNDYFLLYMKILAQDQSEDNRLEKEIRSYLSEYAEEKNLKLLILQTQKAINEIEQPATLKGTCLLKIIPVNELTKTGTMYLNGRELGKLDSGTVVIINLPIGKHTIAIDGEKIERWEKQLEFNSENEMQEIKVEAKVATRQVKITTEPVGARIWIDGKEVGTSPWQGKLEVGKNYEIKTVKEGYRETTTKLSVSDKGDLINVAITLNQNKPPEVPRILSPDDGEKDVKAELTLKWESKDPDGDEVRYDLYFGTSSNPPLLARDLKFGEYKVAGLSWDTTYYWKVIAKDNLGAIREGALVKFTTHKAPGTVKWKTKVGNYCWSPIILGDSIYVTRRYGGELIRLTKSGEIQWRFKAGGDYSTFVAADLNNTLYFCSTDTYVYAVTTDGKLKWKFKTDGEILSSPGIGKDGTIYIGSKDGYLYAINPDGTLKWKVKTGTITFSSPSIDSNGTIYIGGAWNRVFYAVNPDGTIKWNVTLDGPIGSSISFDRNGRIYIGSDASYVYCFDQNGKLIWKTNIGAGCIGEPTISESGLLYISTWEHGKSIPILSQDGKIFKKAPIEGNSVACATIGNDGKAYVLSTDGYLYALTPEGNILWKLLIGKDSWDSPALDTDGTLYVGSSDGYLYAIQTDSYGLADSPWPKARGNLRNTGRFGDK